jgi:Protein of unknown function (DUF4230)
MYKIIWYCYAFIGLFLLGCSQTARQKQQILALKTMSDLATTEFTVTKIVKANDNNTWYTMGDRKILISCQATIKAGIDLSQLKEEDIIASGKKIELHLPEPKLVSFNMPPANIKVEYEAIGPLRSDFSSAERDALMVQAEQQIRNSVEDMGVYKTAKEHTMTFFINYLRRLGFEDIKLNFGNPPNPVTNETIQ